jgi:hypothetical protein
MHPADSDGLKAWGGAAVGQVLQVTGQAVEISAFVQPYPNDCSLGIVSPQVVM